MPIAGFSVARVATAFAFALALLTAGCAGGKWEMGRADRDADPPSANESYVILGLQPQNTQVNVFRGWISDGVFHQNPLLPATFAGEPEGGFVVTRSSAGEAVAITNVVVYSKNALFPRLLVPCEGSKTVVFTVPAGKVIYIGSVRYESIAGGVAPRFGNEFDAARAFMTTHYPKLADTLEQGRFDLMPAEGQGQCVRR